MSTIIDLVADLSLEAVVIPAVVALLVTVAYDVLFKPSIEVRKDRRLEMDRSKRALGGELVEVGMSADMLIRLGAGIDVPDQLIERSAASLEEASRSARRAIPRQGGYIDPRSLRLIAESLGRAEDASQSILRAVELRHSDVARSPHEIVRDRSPELCRVRRNAVPLADLLKSTRIHLLRNGKAIWKIIQYERELSSEMRASEDQDPMQAPRSGGPHSTGPIVQGDDSRG